MAKTSKYKYLLLATILGLNIVFLVEMAVPYMLWKSYKMKFFLGREIWVFTHVCFGMLALLTGPIQFWLAWTSKYLSHKRLGRMYMVAVCIAGIASFYLALANQISWIYGMGLATLGVTWWLTTGLAFLAIRKLKIHRHREWITRSYIATMGFVFFRFFIAIATYLEIGSTTTRLEFASWFCWVFPLLIGEIFIQWNSVRNIPTHLQHN